METTYSLWWDSGSEEDKQLLKLFKDSDLYGSAIECCGIIEPEFSITMRVGEKFSQKIIKGKNIEEYIKKNCSLSED